MNKQERYEMYLQTANQHKKAGRLQEAIHCLDLASKHTSDQMELAQLNLWIKRLRSQNKE